MFNKRKKELMNVGNEFMRDRPALNPDIQGLLPASLYRVTPIATKRHLLITVCTCCQQGMSLFLKKKILYTPNTFKISQC